MLNRGMLCYSHRHLFGKLKITQVVKWLNVFTTEDPHSDGSPSKTTHTSHKSLTPNSWNFSLACEVANPANKIQIQVTLGMQLMNKNNLE